MTDPKEEVQEVENQDQGASPNEQLLFAAKQDLDELFYELESKGGYDINFADGVIQLYTMLLELILEHEGTDVDLLNFQGLTPLHASIQISNPNHRLLISKSLIEAGSNPTIKNKFHQTPLEMLNSLTSNTKNEEDEELKRCLTNAEAELSLDETDLVLDEDEVIDENDQSDLGSSNSD
ncbi:uncharacterized protein MELLADRAFT_64265 [Melampsora larici-populina 98AG31]|uniref:Uncharacterized protein n=1 Tax=Melampsora larici-populina (strain 98AG31 / pathotype 3-4-7) TaxID=747676 RepID=F4RQT6_MELLP|nr:uncharacterized protein MELLADRAFT_64265 [Melampsora larici-populina 98AG31]EGG05096.1 hypothetical protein MELLADRAFT_64265 [Melampsora larici-populina 98AG31]